MLMLDWKGKYHRYEGNAADNDCNVQDNHVAIRLLLIRQHLVNHALSIKLLFLGNNCQCIDAFSDTYRDFHDDWDLDEPEAHLNYYRQQPICEVVLAEWYVDLDGHVDAERERAHY